MSRAQSPLLAMLVLLAGACASAGSAPAQPADDAKDRVIAELATKPDSWVLRQVGGQRVTLDGQTLDLRMQYILQKANEAYAAEKAKEPENARPEEDPFDVPASAAAIRTEANQEWIRRTKPGPALASVRDEQVPSRDGQPIPVRIYHPRARGILPILVYYHGGGWLFGNIAAVDRSSRRLAAEAKVIIVSAEYRLAPEHPYPAAWDDAEDVFGWAVANAPRLGGDQSRICVGGDSAGGNLSVAVSTRTLRAGKPSPACQLLYYAALDNRPVPAMRVDYVSARLFWGGFGLDVPFTEYVLRRVFPGQDLSQPEISPLFAHDIAGMPPTLVAAAGFDPLRDSDRAYAQALKKAGVPTIYLEYKTLPHGFMQQSAVTREADRAATETASEFARLLRMVTH